MKRKKYKVFVIHLNNGKYVGTYKGTHETITNEEMASQALRDHPETLDDIKEIEEFPYEYTKKKLVKLMEKSAIQALTQGPDRLGSLI